MAETCEPSQYFISDDPNIKDNVIIEQTLTGELMPSNKYNGKMGNSLNTSQINKNKDKCTINTYRDMYNRAETGKKRNRIGSFPKERGKGTPQRSSAPYDPDFYYRYIKDASKDREIDVVDTSSKLEGFSYLGGKKSRRKTRRSKKSHRKSSKKQRKSRNARKSRRGRR